MSQTSRYTKSICVWPKDDRPREKLHKYGEHQLSNSELLAILLRTGTRGESALDLARKLLEEFKTFRRMSQADFSRWNTIRGLGPAKIAQIRAALEIGRRFREQEADSGRVKITSSRAVFDLLSDRLGSLPKEVFKTIHLNAANEMIGLVEESSGTVNFATPIIREIFHKALSAHAVSVICAHNHPSGVTEPSQEDERFTRRLAEAGRIMNIKVLDHMIIGAAGYYSFADEGRL